LRRSAASGGPLADRLPALLSPQYAVQSHLNLHGLGPDCLIELFPREDEVNLRTEDILRAIDENGDEVRRWTLTARTTEQTHSLTQ
jgi:hypothetical protein